MAITFIRRDQNDGVNIVRIVSSDTLATIGTAGYILAQDANIVALNHGVFEWLLSDVVLVSASDGWGFFTISSNFQSLTAFVVSSGLTSALTNTHIFVGNALNVATDVALSGDATLANTGALTIANNAITTVKILNANVTLAKLAAGITPSHVIKFANQVTTTGGAAAEAFTVTGAVAATDRAFVQIVDNGTNNVTALQAVVTANVLTVTFSADPGADTIINYQLIRVAS